jgi:general L-amino acid transport system permease protein
MADSTESRPTVAPPKPRSSSRSSWSDPRWRALLYQLLAVGAVLAVVWYLASNTVANLAARNIATGFGFLDQQAGFGIGETLIPYSAADTYFRALLVGLVNTLRVAVTGIVLATILGTIIGVARLSSNWLLARLAAGYVELFRNIPLLLQLFFWYAVITEILPGPRQALHLLPGVFASNRGIKIPIPGDSAVWGYAAAGFALALVLSVLLHLWSRRQRELGRVPWPTGWFALGMCVAFPVIAGVLSGEPLVWDVPKLQGFNFAGGATMSPEFTSLLLGLVIYTAAFIAEIVRSGILAVGRGQREASQALGLTESQSLRLVILPQALRVIVPPLTSQYLNLTKNSTLAVAVGYPDLVSIAGTTLNQTGQAIEGIAIIMAVFLTISLAISLFMNWYNKRIALVER